MKHLEITRKILIVSAALCTVAVPALSYFFTQEAVIAAITAAPVLILFGCLILLDYLHRRSTDDLLESLTLLIESLVDTRAVAPFPEEEDTLLSRLQNQLLKLRAILKSHLEQVDQEKGYIQSLVSDIAHQVKTPVATARAYCELLREDGISDSERQNRLDALQNALDKLTFLTESLIQLSRMESGLIHLSPTPVDLGDLLLEAIKQIYPRAREKSLELNYTPGALQAVRADDRWTAEAIANLLDNAVKYTPARGQITISSSLLPSYVRLDIFSTSVPIPEEEQAQVFARFFRGSASAGQEGVGIGLYLAREIMTHQQGFIRLTTSPRGNTFSMFFQRVQLDPDRLYQTRR